MEDKITNKMIKNAADFYMKFPMHPMEIPIKIDIGAGDKNKKGQEDGTLNEWIHIDGVAGEHIEIVCDFAEIPLPDGIADEIFSGDTIEHIITNKIDRTLKEWNRILKVGGKFTGRCPNLHSTMVRYAKGELSLQDAMGALYGSQDSMWQQHYVTYTADTLKALLEKYGFTDVDLTGSPGYNKETGNPNDSWWLVWSCVKK
jgi:predicted SAM-dependent methyltransferase